MSLFQSIESLADTLIFEQRPFCSECHEAGRGDHRMRAERVYDPGQCVYVDAWECPNCDRVTYRGEDPTMVTPDGERL